MNWDKSNCNKIKKALLKLEKANFFMNKSKLKQLPNLNKGFNRKNVDWVDPIDLYLILNKEQDISSYMVFLF